MKRGRKGGVETEAADFTVVSGQVDCRAAVTGERDLQYRGFPDRLCIVAPRAYAWLSIILRVQREIERWRERERGERETETKVILDQSVRCKKRTCTGRPAGAKNKCRHKKTGTFSTRFKDCTTTSAGAQGEERVHHTSGDTHEGLTPVYEGMED